MIKEVYILESDLNNYSSFLQFNAGDESIDRVGMRAKGNSLKNTYKEIKVDLMPSDTGKRNYKFDISGALAPFIIFSEAACNELQNILLPRGDLFSLITPSKRKKFLGYYSTNIIRGALDKNKSIYNKYKNGYVVTKPVLIKENITDGYLFVIEEDNAHVFVTDKFKKEVEEIGLLGFDFSIKVDLS